DVSRALVNRQQTPLRDRKSFNRSEEDMLSRRLVRIVFACAKEKVFVGARLPIEDLDDRVLLAGFEEIACGFANRDAFTAMKICLSVRSRLLELPGFVVFAIRAEADDVVAVRIHCVNAPFRVNGDAAEFLKALFAEARPFELVIVRA